MSDMDERIERAADEDDLPSDPVALEYHAIHCEQIARSAWTNYDKARRLRGRAALARAKAADIRRAHLKGQETDSKVEG